jgi:serine/threonine-protein kinase
VEVSSRDYSESIPEGDVISTSPAPAGRVLDDGTVEVVVSLGKERYAVPDVTDQTLADAEEALEAANLAVDEPTLRYSGTLDEGLVISASPEPGSMLKPGFAVHLTVSRGPVPIRIPDVRGKTEAVAVERLEDLRFTVTTSEEHSDDVALGEVISQSPSEGTGFRGDEVALVISSGPKEVEVPDVLGQGIEEATSALVDAGFEVEVVEDSPYFGLGYVTDQDPYDTTAPVGSSVTLYVI